MKAYKVSRYWWIRFIHCRPELQKHAGSCIQSIGRSDPRRNMWDTEAYLVHLGHVRCIWRWACWSNAFHNARTPLFPHQGRRSGFFNSTKLGSKDFCGEELLTWVLDTRQSCMLPSSTRTVKAVSDVEGFALKAEDLKFITTQFRRMHSIELRFYSQQWRTWAACFIQAAWRRHKRKSQCFNEEIRDNWEEEQCEDQQEVGCLYLSFPSSRYQHMDVFVPRPGAGIEIYAARLLANKRSLSSRFR